MRYLRSLPKTKQESWRHYASRLSFAVTRRISPRLREEYRRELLIGPQNCWDELVRYQFNIVTGLGLKPENSLLDIGCGPIALGVQAIPYLEKGNYVGVDLRIPPLTEAYRLVAKYGLAIKNPVFVNSDTFGQNELGSRVFDFVWMSQLSCHLDEQACRQLFAQAQARVRRGGVFAFDIMDPARSLPNGSQWSGFSFHIRPVSFYEELGKEHSFSMTQRGRIVDFGYPRRIDLHTNLLLEFQAR